MTKTLYQVGEGANLALYPRGTQVGSIVELTEAQAMYERDLGRLTEVNAKGKNKPSPVANSDGAPDTGAAKPQDVKVMEVEAPVDQVEQAKLEAARRRR